MLRKLHDQKELLRGHQACYEMTREVLKMLGRAKDDGYIEDDVMSQKMLDFAMMDYILETNKLKEMKRCFLCLQRQQHHKGSNKLASSTPAEICKGPKSKPQDGNIKRSHLIPHGVGLLKVMVKSNRTPKIVQKMSCLVSLAQKWTQSALQPLQPSTCCVAHVSI